MRTMQCVAWVVLAGCGRGDQPDAAARFWSEPVRELVVVVLDPLEDDEDADDGFWLLFCTAPSRGLA